MRNSARISACLLVLAIVPAVPVIGSTVNFDTTVDFSAYKTFTWQEGTPARYPENQARIESAIEQQLEAKGLRKVDGDADLYVVTYVSVDARTSLDADRYEADWAGWISPRGHVRFSEVGTLVVDLVEAASDKLVWRGSASGVLAEAKQKNLKKIDKAAKKMFNNFPPK